MSTTSDAALLEQWSGGDRTAAEVLLRRYIPIVHRFFKTKVDEPEEFAQRTLSAFIDARDRIRNPASLRSFILGIARYELLRHVRRASGRREVELSEIDINTITRSPLSLAIAGQNVRRVVDALRRIPVDHQIALELYYWEELSTREISEVLAAPQGTVRSRITRARADLRRALEAHGETSQAMETDAMLAQWIASMRAKVVAS